VTVWWILFFVAVGVVAVLALFGAFRLVRALVNTRESGPPAWWAVLLAAVVLLVVPAVAVATYFVLPVPVTERTLTQSIERETGSAGLHNSSSCSGRPGGAWRCSISDSSGSGSVEYAVTAGDQCWHATLRTNDAEGPMPARPEGCATLRDVRVFD
jgi:heme/copper-type cytochrome/quinol oxidase subunit 2